MTVSDDPPPPLDGARHSLFLDVDGGLIEIAPEAGTVQLAGGGPMLLERVALALGGALGLLSGRQATAAAPPPPPDMDTARRRLRERIMLGDPLSLADEQAALTVDFSDATAERAEEIAREAVAGLDGVEVVRSPTSFTIRPRAAPVAPAMLALLDAPPFQGRTPVFVGAAAGDEAGFLAASQAGGYGIKIGPGETGARYRLLDPPALRDWLARLGERG